MSEQSRVRRVGRAVDMAVWKIMGIAPPTHRAAFEGRHEIFTRLLAERAGEGQSQTGVRRILARMKIEFWAYRQTERELQVRCAKLTPVKCDDRAALRFNSATMVLAALGWLFLQLHVRELAGATLLLPLVLGPAFLVLTVLDLIRTKRTWRLWLALGFGILSVALTVLAFYHAIVGQYSA